MQEVQGLCPNRRTFGQGMPKFRVKSQLQSCDRRESFPHSLPLTCRYCNIGDRQTCGEAAEELGLKVKNAVPKKQGNNARPPGCYRNEGMKLWFNDNLSSDGRAQAKDVLLCYPCRIANIQCAAVTKNPYATTRDPNCKGRCAAGVKYRGDGYVNFKPHTCFLFCTR